jgi:hypothetical protein
MADTTKFRQENALYAFTIVTIIFLPLSAVSSNFGMNTNDFRDMEQGQWLYWATAIPVTVTVVLLGLFWTGELGNAFRWIYWGIARWVFRHLADDPEERRRIADEWVEADTFLGRTSSGPLIVRRREEGRRRDRRDYY